jgi:hypothetical protein
MVVSPVKQSALTTCSGHYDILYKLEDLPQRAAPPPVVAPQNVFVALNHASTETTHHKIAFDLDNIEIPGMSFYPGPNIGWSGFPQYDFSPVSVSQPVSSPRSLPTSTYPSLPAAHAPEYYAPSAPVTTPSIPTVTLPHHPAPHAPIDRVGPFRPSIWEYETNFAPAAPHPPLCQTAIFRKYASHHIMPLRQMLTCAVPTITPPISTTQTLSQSSGSLIPNTDTRSGRGKNRPTRSDTQARIGEDALSQCASTNHARQCLQYCHSSPFVHGSHFIHLLQHSDGATNF